jgi:zinc protease
MNRSAAWVGAAMLATSICAANGRALAGESKYCVVVSESTRKDAEWNPVTETLVGKHAAEVLTFGHSVREVLPNLRQRFPRYICFVCRPDEATREFVADVSQLCRQVDDDPYADAIWGILTGYDAACALRIAKHSEPLEIHRVAAGTEVELSLCDEGLWYCELNKGKMFRKSHGQPVRQETAPADTTKALVDTLNDYKAQLFVTSGHATERDWQIGYRYRNGQFRSEKGQLFGLDTRGQRYPIHSENPKVYLPVGNCLMGHIDGADAMALAFLNSAGVNQMIGYTVPSWYGYAGWGLLDYFVEQPGRFTLAEAFFANEQALVYRLGTHFPELATTTNDDAEKAMKGAVPPVARQAGLNWNDASGLIYDRDTLAFYGDPAWVARMAAGSLAWQQTLEVKDNEYRFEIRPLRADQTFRPINLNGSQRGGRPIFQFLPHRIQPTSVELTEGADIKPLITDNFLLIPLPAKFDPGRQYRVAFRALAAKE